MFYVMPSWFSFGTVTNSFNLFPVVTVPDPYREILVYPAKTTEQRHQMKFAGLTFL